MRRAAGFVAGVFVAFFVAAFSVVAGALAAGPAYAHGSDAPDGTAYRTTVTAVTPAEPGLRVRAVEAGARLELSNRTKHTVEILGYSGEPYLEVRTDGTYENVNSPTTYLNRTLDGDTPVPAGADPALPPQWRRVSGDTTVRWHDHRTHWMSTARPAAAVADPARTHRLRDWEVPLRDGVRTFAVRGTLDWVPPPRPGLWWAGSLLTAAAVAALGTLSIRRPSLLRAVVAVALVAGTTTIAYAVARQVDAAAPLTGQLTPTLAGLGALAAGGPALARRQIADFALALAGAGLAVFAGLADAGVFASAVAPVPGPSWTARVAVLIALGGGAGLVAAGVLRLRAAARSAAARSAAARSAAAPSAAAPSAAAPSGAAPDRIGREAAGPADYRAGHD